MTNDLIAQARRKYLSENPIRTTDIAAFTSDGSPAEPFVVPNLDDIGILGCKLGMEYLAICHDEEAVEEWIQASIGVAKSPELVGILFANVFRGVNIVIGEIIGQTSGLRQQMEKLALEAWGKNFAEGFPA